MGTLRISLFGCMRIEHDDWPKKAKLSPVAQILLAYLLLEPDRHYSREALMALFWEDYTPKQARSCLNTALWRLRQVLEPKGVAKETYLLTSSHDEVGFNWDSQHWLDVTIFEEAARNLARKPAQTIDTASIEKLEEALALRSGDFLEGFYDDWAIRERERLHQLYLDSLEHLMLFYKHHQAYEQSLAYGQQLLDQDPLRESIHRELMRIYWEANQPAMAVRQYQTCRKWLAKELNITPMAETQSLYERIIAESNQRAVPIPVPSGQVDLQQAMRQLLFALEESKRAQIRLQQASDLVRQYVNQHISDNQS